MVPGLPTHFIAIFLLLTIITAEKELNLTKKERKKYLRNDAKMRIFKGGFYMSHKLKIDFEMLLFAMRNHDGWFDQYVDLKNGRIVAEEESFEDPEIRFDKNDPERYLFIEPYPSNEGLLLMEEFIEGVKNQKVQEKLIEAISGEKPFRDFRDVLTEFPENREAWNKFEGSRIKEYAIKWLKNNDVEPIEKD